MSYYARPWYDRLGDFIGKVICTIIDFFEDFGFWVIIITSGVAIAWFITHLIHDDAQAKAKNAETVVERFAAWSFYASKSCTPPIERFELGTETLTYVCGGKTFVLDKNELDRAAHCTRDQCAAKSESLPVIDLAHTPK